jgi:PadR family transcriptional regulator PadR
MEKREYLGDFEQLVLFAVLRLGDNAYGVPIHQEIEQRAGRRTSIAAVYTTLSRLEQKGYVSSWTGESTPERGGRAKRYFRIEASGSAALRQSHLSSSRMAEGLLGVAL